MFRLSPADHFWERKFNSEFSIIHIICATMVKLKRGVVYDILLKPRAKMNIMQYVHVCVMNDMCVLYVTFVRSPAVATCV